MRPLSARINMVLVLKQGAEGMMKFFERARDLPTFKLLLLA